MTTEDQKPKRPRLTDAQRLARLDAERVKIMSRQKTADRRLADRRKIIVGATILNAIEADAELRARVCALLNSEVQRPQDREAVTPWLSAI